MRRARCEREGENDEMNGENSFTARMRHGYYSP
jgi:hypothetical protein